MQIKQTIDSVRWLIHAALANNSGPSTDGLEFISAVRASLFLLYQEKTVEQSIHRWV